MDAVNLLARSASIRSRATHQSWADVMARPAAREAVVVRGQPEKVPAHRQAFHDADGQPCPVTEPVLDLLVIKLGEDAVGVGVDFEHDPMLPAKHPQSSVEPTEIGVMHPEE